MKKTITCTKLNINIATDLCYDLQIEQCLQAFKYFYEHKKYNEAFEQIWLAISLFENSDNHALKIELFRCSILCLPYFTYSKESLSLLEAIISHESVTEQPEVLSMCYFLLSVNALENLTPKTAVDYSILSYYYAKKCSDDERFYECNAQLQLVSSLLENCDVEQAQSYINKFQWYLENCKNVQERIFIVSIQASKTLLENNEEHALLQIEQLLHKFLQSEEMMYTSFLALHFKRMLTKFAKSEQRYALIELCDCVIDRITPNLSQVKTITTNSFTTHSRLFYKQAMDVLEQHIQDQQQTALHKFAGSSDFSVALLIEALEQQQLTFLIHAYAPNRYTIITCCKGHELLLALYEQQKLEPLANFCMQITSKQQFYTLFYSHINFIIMSKSFLQNAQNH